MIRPPDLIEEGPMRRLGRILVDHFVPAVLAAGLNAAQRYGYLTLVPLNVVIERQYGTYALFLAAIAAFVAASAFTRGGCRFGVVAFLTTALLSIVMVSPFVLARYEMDVGLTPMQFSLVSTFAYLGFSITVGLLIGGSWSTVVRAFRDPGPIY
jgi:hypothetical protein